MLTHEQFATVESRDGHEQGWTAGRVMRLLTLFCIVVLGACPACVSRAPPSRDDFALGGVTAPCWSPLGHEIRAGTPVTAVLPHGTSVERPHTRYDVAALPLLGLFVATPVVLQGTVKAVALASSASGDGGQELDATIAVDDVVRDLSGPPLVRGTVIHAFFPAASGRATFAPALAIEVGQQSVWLLKSKGAAFVPVSGIIESITVDSRGGLTALPMLESYPSNREIASAKTVTGLCSLLRSATKTTPKTRNELEQALLRWAAIVTPAQQHVYQTQMRRDADAVAVYLYIAKTQLGIRKDRSFPSMICSSGAHGLASRNKLVSRPCMSLKAMLDRAEGSAHVIYP